jgi:hypothetical protein
MKQQPAQSAHMRKFLNSMIIDYEKWHDGIGYDLDALKAMSQSEVQAVEQVLIDHQPRDWRDIEALAQIDSPAAKKAVETALRSHDPKVRLEALRHVAEKVDNKERERLMIEAIETRDLYDGLSDVIDELPDFHPPGAIEALFRGSLKRDGEAAVHFAALLMYLHGKAAEPFDWNHRPFFLRFNTTDRGEREAAFRELCAIVGVDPEKYLGS